MVGIFGRFTAPTQLVPTTINHDDDLGDYKNNEDAVKIDEMITTGQFSFLPFMYLLAGSWKVAHFCQMLTSFG